MNVPARLSQLPGPAPIDDRVVARAAMVACTLAGLVVAGFLSVSVVQRYLVNDDYQLLYTAWMKSRGLVPGRDFAITSYHLLVDVLRPLFSWFPESWVPLYVGRAGMVVGMALTGLLVVRVTRPLFGPLAAALAPMFALCTSDVLARALDLRPDLLSTVLWLGIIAVCVDARKVRASPWLILVGVLAGVAVVNRFKAALIIPWIGLVVLADAALSPGTPGARARDAALRTLWLAVGFVVVGLGYVALLQTADDPAEFARVMLGLGGVVASYDDDKSRALQERTLSNSMLHDPLTWVFVGLGVVVMLASWRRMKPVHRVALIGMLATAFSFVWFNAAFYNYNLVTLVPLLAPFAGGGAAAIVRAMQRSHRGWAIVLAIGFVATPAVASWRWLRHATVDSAAAQRELQRFLVEATAPDAPVFALEGVGLFRPSTFHWRFSAVLQDAYNSGSIPIGKELVQTKPLVVIESYRVPDWLNAADVAVLAEHYVELKPRILVPGRIALDATRSWDCWHAGTYDVVVDTGATCTFDGAALQPSTTIAVEAGVHTLVAAGGSCMLRWSFPAGSTDGLSNAAGTRYLFAPDAKPPGRF